MGGLDTVVLLIVVLATALCYVSVLFLTQCKCVSAGEHGNVLLGCHV